jgi:hypothetical protein
MKKSINKKSARKFIIENRNNGKTDQEIYNELSLEYYDKKSIALLITGTVTNENKKKYGIYNKILLSLLVITVLLKVFSVFLMTLQENEIYILLLIFIVPILNIIFIIEISRYTASIYRLCGIMSILSIFQSFSHVVNGIDMFLSIILGGLIAGLSYYLHYKLFPRNNPNELKKDANGEYELT